MDEPLSLDEVKLNLRVDTDAEDVRIAELIVTAREYVESETDLALVPRIITETARELGRWIDLASWPVIEIVEIRYPLAGAMTPLLGGSWQASFARRPVRVLPLTPGWGVAGAWGAPFRGALPVEIDVAAGFATPAAVPMRAKQAMHMLVSHWYTNRSAVEAGARAAAIDIPLGVASLLDKLRVKKI